MVCFLNQALEIKFPIFVAPHTSTVVGRHKVCQTEEHYLKVHCEVTEPKRATEQLENGLTTTRFISGSRIASTCATLSCDARLYAALSLVVFQMHFRQVDLVARSR